MVYADKRGERVSRTSVGIEGVGWWIPLAGNISLICRQKEKKTKLITGLIKLWTAYIVQLSKVFKFSFPPVLLYYIPQHTHEHMRLLAGPRPGVRLKSKTCGRIFFLNLAHAWPRSPLKNGFTAGPSDTISCTLYYKTFNASSGYHTICTSTNHRVFTSIAWTRGFVIILYNITLYTLRDGLF